MVNGSEREAVLHLLWVWYTYGKGFTDHTGIVCLPHMNASAGEDAADYLESLGLGRDVGCHFELNEVGRCFMDL